MSGEHLHTKTWASLRSLNTCSMFLRNGAHSSTKILRALGGRRRVLCRRGVVNGPYHGSDVSTTVVDRGFDYEERVRSLKEGGDLARCYPRLQRLPRGTRGMPPSHFINEFSNKLFTGETDQDELLQITGKVKARRVAGSKLVFFDVEGAAIDGPPVTTQVICNHSVVRKFVSPLQEETETVSDTPDVDDTSVTTDDTHDVVPLTSNVTPEEFKEAYQMLRVGDWASFQGHPHMSKTSQLSILATRLPTLLAPMLHQLPEKLTDMENINRQAHVKILHQPQIRELMRLRMNIEDTLDFHCKSKGLTRVRTPIIGGSSGGAAAESFETKAQEFSNEKLTLRIAPELYLKRLIVGGLHGVYEIGPAFRNEGIDATHNPEFTICEYYQRHTRLYTLMRDTEDLLGRMNRQTHSWQHKYGVTLDRPNLQFSSPFPYIDFTPTLNRHLQRVLSDPSFQLPDLEQSGTAEALRQLFPKLKLPLPANPTVPRMLDDLSKHYLEQDCVNPTWIIHQPACLAPLAKSFIHERTGQHVSARAELFIGRREYVNCYEEENSPFEQRKKFLQQRQLQSDTSDAQNLEPEDSKTSSTSLPAVEESYIEALEWGLPPTGGWGCGVDRLVMLFAGVDRIADVLPFGTLRTVVSMGKPLRR